MKFYREQPIEAEQFDGSDEMVDKYELIDAGTMLETHHSPELYLTGSGKVDVDDWIITDNFNHHTLMTDKEFHKQYAELPVIPQAVVDWIEKCKSDSMTIGDMLCSVKRPEKMRYWMAFAPGTYKFDQRRYSKCQDLVARAWIGEYQVEADK